MSKLDTKFTEAVDRFSMLREGDSVIVALSGGADSVALLNVLNSNKEKYKLKIYAAHLNHNLRGDEALRDENFVRSLCEQKGVELFVRSLDIGKLSRKQGIGTELCGRNERYAFFAELSESVGAKVATAHTASDNAETVLFNLTRGAGPNGFSGIQPVRDNIIRPLILCTRDEVEEYCRDNSLDYVTDSTNLGDDYTRNKIRHSVIPVLKQINPDFENTVLAESGMMKEINSYLELKSHEIIDKSKVPHGWDCSVIADCPQALRLSVLRTLCLQNGISPDFSALMLLSDALLCGGAVDLHGSLRAECRQGVLRFIEKEKTSEKFSSIELKLNSEFTYNNKYYSVIENKYGALGTHILSLKPSFRTRREGDRFTLPGRRVTKSLKKLFNELKIPAEVRDSVLLLACDSEVLWIEGVGASAKAKPENGAGFDIIIGNR